MRAAYTRVKGFKGFKGFNRFNGFGFWVRVLGSGSGLRALASGLWPPGSGLRALACGLWPSGL
jgi:hypothetical protein